MRARHRQRCGQLVQCGRVLPGGDQGQERAQESVMGEYNEDGNACTLWVA